MTEQIWDETNIDEYPDTVVVVDPEHDEHPEDVA